MAAIFLIRHHGGEQRHAARLLQRYQHVGGAMLQRLKTADGDAELLSRLEVVDRELVHGRHGADSLGGKRGHCRIRDLFNQRESASRIANGGISADPHAGEGHFGGALTVDGVVAAGRNARRPGIDEKQGDAVLLALSAAHPRRNHKAFRAVAVQHQSFGAVEHVTGTVAARRGSDVGKIVACLPFAMRERQDEVAGGDLRNELAA
jgi:hypothetical protein